jgi:hypothetical protein
MTKATPHVQRVRNLRVTPSERTERARAERSDFQILMRYALERLLYRPSISAL